MYKIFKEKTTVFILLLILLSIIFTVISYRLLLQNYELAENKVNQKNIQNIIERVENKINFLYKISLDYGSLDDAYNFIEKDDNSFLYKNFREGSYTLEDHDLDFFIVSDLNQNIRFSKYTKGMTNDNKEEFEKALCPNGSKEEKYTSIVKINNNSYFVSKTPIHKSDYESKSNGYLYLGSKINEHEINKLTKGSMNSRILDNDLKVIGSSINLNSNYFSKVRIDKVNEDNYISNNIYFYNKKLKLVLGINSKTKQIVLNEATITMILFIILLTLYISTLLYITSKYKKELKTHNEQLEEKVEERTEQIKSAMVELEKVNLKLYDIAHTDFLTKTMNRRNFFIHAQNSFSISKKNNQPLAAIMIDIDNFKSFNDRYGHDIGDKVLVMFSETIKKHIGKDDIFGRLGGEEFALVIQNISLNDATKKAEELKQKIEEVVLPISNDTLTITASFGVSDNNKCANIDEMLQKADKLLYTAKNSGRNLVRSRLNLC